MSSTSAVDKVARSDAQDSSHERISDKSRVLKPASKKLTSVDGMRVMSVLDDTLRRVEIVAGLQHTIESLERLSTVLGKELLEKLRYYGFLLYLFHEISTWRRLTVGDLQLPPAAKETVLRSFLIQPTDGDGGQGDMVVQKPAPKRLPEFRAGAGQEAEGSAASLSSAKMDSLIFGGNISVGSMDRRPLQQVMSGSDLNVQADKSETRVYDLEGGEISISSIRLPKQPSADDEYVDFPELHILASKFSGLISQDSLTQPRTETQDQEPSAEEKPSWETLVSGSDIKVRQDSLADVESFYEILPSSDSLTGSRRKLDSYSRVRRATENLTMTSKEMEATCRNILRMFRNNPVATKAVLAQNQYSTSAAFFLGQLVELKAIVFDRLLTTPLEELEQREYLDDVQKHVAELLQNIKQLEMELTDTIRDKEQKIKAADEKIKQLQADMLAVQQLADEFIRRTRQDAAKQQANDVSNSSGRQVRPLQEAGTLRAQLAKIRRENWANEAALRARKYKIETEIDNWIQTYDHDMTELQTEYDEVEAQYKIEKAQLEELEERFAPLNAEFQIIMEEREMAYKAVQSFKREEERRLQAALALQAWWRSYRVRKACVAKAKRLAKLAKKAAKKGKGKGKKKKVPTATLR